MCPATRPNRYRKSGIINAVALVFEFGGDMHLDKVNIVSHGM
jgi:hypothetical protein